MGRRGHLVLGCGLYHRQRHVRANLAIRISRANKAHLSPNAHSPSVGTLSGLVAAICIFQFTYTFPPLFQLALEMHKDAIRGDEAFQTAGVRPRQIDTWRQAVRDSGSDVHLEDHADNYFARVQSRWRRAIFGGSTKSTILKYVPSSVSGIDTLLTSLMQVCLLCLLPCCARYCRSRHVGFWNRESKEV